MKKVWGIGLPRTGTKTLTLAMQTLGWSGVHNPKRLTDFNDYDHASDMPACLNVEMLNATYRDSLFVLTVRDIDKWLDSCERWFNAPMPPTGTGPGQLARSIGSPVFDRDVFRAGYGRHVSLVRAFFASRQSRLLTLDICGGDTPDKLCDFLGVPNTLGGSFPVAVETTEKWRTA